MADITLFKEVEKRGHEQVTYFYYPQVGLKAIVGIHNTVLGPALGGCRMRLYTDENKALEDVLRLSEGMTYKSAVAGLDLGGGKACLIADPEMKQGRHEMFVQFGHCLNHLNGRYISAEDMGTSVADVMAMREVTRFVAGIAPEEGGGGDPSPWTARGVYKAILAACERRFGNQNLTGKHVTVQGVGHVGMYLVKYLKEAGAKITVCDTNESLLQVAKKDYSAEVVKPDAIYDVDCDIYAPCAVGQTVNADTLGRLKCKIIAGAANNQLQDNSLYSVIQAKNILYCPDFVVNSGGVINVGAEHVPGGWKENWVREKVDAIYSTTHKVLEQAEKRAKFPEVVALELAWERIKAAEERKTSAR